MMMNCGSYAYKRGESNQEKVNNLTSETLHILVTTSSQYENEL